VKSLQKLFYKTSISKIDLSQFDTSNLKDISYMFSTTRISSIDFTNFDTSNVEDMSKLFEGCTSLLDINFN
jgi:surface protein